MCSKWGQFDDSKLKHWRFDKNIIEKRGGIEFYCISLLWDWTDNPFEELGGDNLIIKVLTRKINECSGN